MCHLSFYYRIIIKETEAFNIFHLSDIKEQHHNFAYFAFWITFEYFYDFMEKNSNCLHQDMLLMIVFFEKSNIFMNIYMMKKDRIGQSSYLTNFYVVFLLNFEIEDS